VDRLPALGPAGTSTEAEARYLDEVREDCEGCLGPGARLIDLRREDAGPNVRLVARYRLGDREEESAGLGENVVVAHSVLRARILFDRIRFGFGALVERG
jgi:hypothetical protein